MMYTPVWSKSQGDENFKKKKKSIMRYVGVEQICWSKSQVFEHSILTFCWDGLCLRFAWYKFQIWIHLR